jgi:regulator of RNase E activity RraA
MADDPDLLARARGVSTATLTTRLFARGIRHSVPTDVRPLSPGPRLAGWAYTLRYVPSREDLDRLDVFTDPSHPQRFAVEHAPEDSVLVMDARGDLRAGTIGAILVTRLRARGVAGVVSDGAVRDGAGIKAVGLPVYCRGTHPSTNLTVHRAVDVNVPIGCGGVLVEPGDLVVGDDDGVVVVPRAIAEDVVAEAEEQDDLERYLAALVAQGRPLPGTYPPSAETRAAYERWRASGRPPVG